ncbi:MAG: RNA polymerase sigma factor [Acidobacteriota bacterium]
MPKQSIEDILVQLDSRDPHHAWDEFLQAYSGLIFQVARHFEKDSDSASDCFQFVCERLSEKRFRRLLRFDPKGVASFSTWLRAVVRNLCLDWSRKEFGRRRKFRSISRLSAFDQQVFHCIHECGLSIDEAHRLLQSRAPGLTYESVAESNDRIEQHLTVQQRWLLRTQLMRRAPRVAITVDEVGGSQLEIPDPRPDPETQAASTERQAALERALGRLTKRERLLVRLRFEQELTLEQIARLLNLGNAQRVDRQIKDILARLREALR